MTEISPRDGWAERLSPGVRLALLALAVMACVFAIGMVAGYSRALFQHGGDLAPRAIGVLALAILGTGLFGWLSWRLGAHWRQPERGAYERRYARMMLLLLLLGLPLGMLMRLVASPSALFTNAPLAPAVSALAALLLVVTLGATLILYHRTIDDFEQRAYLWANSLSFYFLALALPSAWLLARGGWIDPVGIGSALVILLASVGINALVWFWLKFR